MKKIPFFILLLFCIAFSVFGQELRPFTPIRTKTAIVRQLPPGSRLVEPPQPLPEGTVGSSVDAIASSWNTQEFQKLVSDSFYNKSRLDDAMATETAKDARLRVLDKHSANILSQIITPDPNGGRLRITTVSVVIDTRAEFNDPKNGFISAPGTNEMIMEIVEKVD